MFDCQMTVKGNGSGGNGRFVHDTTGPISRFMVDNVHLYPKVKRHVLECPLCDPTEALRFYLNRRLTLDKFKPVPGKPWPIAGHLTGTLGRLALSYEREAKKTRPIPKDLVDEFLWRSGDWELIDKHEKRLSVKNLVSAAQLIRPSTTSDIPKVESLRFGYVLKLVYSNIVPETEQELEDLIVVAEVALT